MLNDEECLTIGIHIGSFSGGIVGSSKYLFDVFGDDINTCYRIAECIDGFKIIGSIDFSNDIKNENLNTHMMIKTKNKNIKCVNLHI